ncbi:sigma-70 family RNA polymerase sigma factor [Mucilaginibacter pallidiroseus]|uniref:Sigma-70 family RNA polymerase sigma factor n=1 Tax=Mucilaginibacter pallidiroseus TaxID=2599295 RepID=A0A563UFW4_9SPHI|nr:sigma-70 family RNA polymerase sigma factor [Mucilaginibacter pallidiroseus]TWR30272.1 sigma-70 family RNA polymerase sigma factor [Mucilaginibacter pallidiroseus]
METVCTPPFFDLQQFENVFKEHYAALYRYVKSIVKDDDLAKDVLSDLFLNLWVQKDKLQIQFIKSYLFRAARNGSLKALNVQSASALTEDYWDITEDSFNPLERIVAKESIRIVEELMNKLPATRKEIIHLRLCGLKNHEIAKTLDITEKKVEYNMREAIEQLSYYMNNSNYDKATIAGGLMLVNIIFTLI